MFTRSEAWALQGSNIESLGAPSGHVAKGLGWSVKASETSKVTKVPSAAPTSYIIYHISYIIYHISYNIYIYIYIYISYIYIIYIYIYLSIFISIFLFIYVYMHYIYLFVFKFIYIHPWLEQRLASQHPPIQLYV